MVNCMHQQLTTTIRIEKLHSPFTTTSTTTATTTMQTNPFKIIYKEVNLFPGVPAVNRPNIHGCFHSCWLHVISSWGYTSPPALQQLTYFEWPMGTPRIIATNNCKHDILRLCINPHWCRRCQWCSRCRWCRRCRWWQS